MHYPESPKVTTSTSVHVKVKFLYYFLKPPPPRQRDLTSSKKFQVLSGRESHVFEITATANETITIIN